MGQSTTAGPSAAAVSSFERDALPLLNQLYRAAVRFTRSATDAEDLVQETYLEAYANFGALPPGASLRVWMYRILADRYLRGGRAGAAPGPAPAIGGPDPAGAEAEALDRLPAADVKAAVDALPADARMAVHLADVEGFGYAEIAEILGTDVDTVISYLHRGRRRLREMLRETAREF
jgi:RNA polymerase sigma-70 factor (ECF subfamily)